MSNVLFSYVNHIDATATVLTSSSQLGDLSIQNVADTRIGKRHRCAGPSAYGQADFGSDVSIDIVALVFPRDTALATGTVRHQFDADGGTPGTGAAHDSTAIDLGLIDGYGYHVYQPASTVTARYWRWTYALTSAFADTGRAWAGEKWVPDVNFDLGAADAWNDLSVVTQSRRSGAEFADLRLKQRGFSFSLGFMDEDDKAVAQELKRLVGISKQILCLKDPAAAARNAVVGRLASIDPITDANFNLYSTPFAVRESL